MLNDDYLTPDAAGKDYTATLLLMENMRMVYRLVHGKNKFVVVLPITEKIANMSEDDYYILISSAEGIPETKLRNRTESHGDAGALWKLYTTLATARKGAVQPDSSIAGMRAAKALLQGGHSVKELGPYLAFWMLNQGHFETVIGDRMDRYGMTLRTFQMNLGAIMTDINNFKRDYRDDSWYKHDLVNAGLPEDLC